MPPPYLKVCASSPPGHTKKKLKIMETRTQIEQLHFTGTTSGLDPTSQPRLKQPGAELRPLIQREPQKPLWQARGATSAADITTFQAFHGGFLCSRASQTRFKYLSTLEFYFRTAVRSEEVLAEANYVKPFEIFSFRFTYKTPEKLCSQSAAY